MTDPKHDEARYALTSICLLLAAEPNRTAAVDEAFEIARRAIRDPARPSRDRPLTDDEIRLLDKLHDAMKRQYPRTVIH